MLEPNNTYKGNPRVELNCLLRSHIQNGVKISNRDLSNAICAGSFVVDRDLRRKFARY